MWNQYEEHIVHIENLWKLKLGKMENIYHDIFTTILKLQAHGHSQNLIYRSRGPRDMR
jgi:hypothetical protein